MNTLDEPFACDDDWLGCEAMHSVPAFGLPQPAEQGDRAGMHAAQGSAPPQLDAH